MNRPQKKKNIQATEVKAIQEQKELDAKIVIIVPDGNQFCATRGDHINLQESPAGFGDNHSGALLNLFNEEKKLKLKIAEKN